MGRVETLFEGDFAAASPFLLQPYFSFFFVVRGFAPCPPEHFRDR